MTLMNTLRLEILAGNIPPIFSSDDLRSANIKDINHNLSNYDKKNKGAKNNKVLVSRDINGVVFYTFDEQLFME